MWIYTIELQYNDRYFVLLGSPRLVNECCWTKRFWPGTSSDLLVAWVLTGGPHILKIHTFRLKKTYLFKKSKNKKRTADSWVHYSTAIGWIVALISCLEHFQWNWPGVAQVQGFAVVFEDDGKVNPKERKNRAKRQKGQKNIESI